MSTLVAAGVLLSTCGPSTYGGPLYISPEEDTSVRPLIGSGAAGRALHCDGEPYRGGSGKGNIAFSAGDSPIEGLREFVGWDLGDLPAQGYDQVREENPGYHPDLEQKHRVLFAYDVDGETKIAIIVTEYAPGRWHMETYAQCDPAELPAVVAEELGFEVWTDKSGDRVPVTELIALPGFAHCETETVTFLYLQEPDQDGESDQDSPDQYARDPDGRLSRDLLVTSYAIDVKLPPDAIDTGYRLDDWQLWLSARRTSAYVVMADGIERWPRTKDFIGCM